MCKVQLPAGQAAAPQKPVSQDATTRAAPWEDYVGKPVYSTISHRFLEKYKIRLGEHIHKMLHVAAREEEGIDFVVVDAARVIQELKATKAFHHDDRSDLESSLPAAATSGEGYREIAEISLHCEIAPAICNIHIDKTGFIWRSPDGQEFIGPDAPRHIVDELVWGGLVQAVSGKSEYLGKVIGRAHIVVPSTENKFDPKIGVNIELAHGEEQDATKRWSLTAQVLTGCTDSSCKQTATTGMVVLTIRR